MWGDGKYSYQELSQGKLKIELLKNIKLGKTLKEDSKFLMGQKSWEIFDVVYGLAPLVVVQVAKC